VANGSSRGWWWGGWRWRRLRKAANDPTNHATGDATLNAARHSRIGPFVVGQHRDLSWFFERSDELILAHHRVGL
jgi:hypothetical protein